MCSLQSAYLFPVVNQGSRRDHRVCCHTENVHYSCKSSLKGTSVHSHQKIAGNNLVVELLYLISGPDTRLVLVMMTQSFPVSPCEEFLMSPGHHDLSASASIVERMEVEVDIVYFSHISANM